MPKNKGVLCSDLHESTFKWYGRFPNPALTGGFTQKYGNLWVSVDENRPPTV